MEDRLQNILADAGVASRRASAALIEEGRVKVDGRVVKEKGLRLDASKHKITVDERPLRGCEKKYYFLFHKPKDVITTVIDTHDRKKVSDYFRSVPARLYPVGRLDKDTTGILIVTNDGEFANRLAHPRYEVDKEYLAEVKGEVSLQDIERLKRGVVLEGKRTAPCEIIIEDQGRYRIKIHEGKKRQIRKMFEMVGAEVLELKRVKYAGLVLGNLKEGEYRELTEKEIDGLRQKAH